MKDRVLLAAILLPVLVLAGWVARLETRARSGKDVWLAVEAYDPRDLLAGHYLTYRVDYGIDPCQGMPSRDEPSCLCLSDEVPARATWSGSCSNVPAECTLVEGRCSWSRFEADIERFYIPEQYTGKLTAIPPGSRIRVSVQDDGRALVRDFFVQDVPLEQYVQSH